MQSLRIVSLAALLWFACTQPAEQQADQSTQQESMQTTTSTQPGFVHTVFFWLREDLTADDMAAFEAGLRTLATISHVRDFQIGTPAGTPREVVDNSYGMALILRFDDAAGQDAYQIDPIHLAFVDGNKQYWTRVQVYDTVLK
ncbi:MAG: hypothetical protein OHK0039_18410 [Bacteroidia bacterium]